jgi:hypothetical protein
VSTLHIVSLLGVVLLSDASFASDCSMADLKFLRGEWHSVDGDTRGVERWSLTAANTLAGSSWVVKGGAVSFAEALSIAALDGGIEMHLRHFDGALNHAWEEKDSPMVFRLARCEAGYAVFDGTGDKTGEHISYRRSGDRLDFTGDFLRQGKPFRVAIEMHEATD